MVAIRNVAIGAEPIIRELVMNVAQGSADNYCPLQWMQPIKKRLLLIH